MGISHSNYYTYILHNIQWLSDPKESRTRLTWYLWLLPAPLTLSQTLNISSPRVSVPSPQVLISIETCHLSHTFSWFPLSLPPPSLCSSWLTLGFSSSRTLCLLLSSHDPVQSGPFQKPLSAFSLISTVNLLINHTSQQSCLRFYSVFMQLCKIHVAMTKCNICLHKSGLLI